MSKFSYGRLGEKSPANSLNSFYPKIFITDEDGSYVTSLSITQNPLSYVTVLEPFEGIVLGRAYTLIYGGCKYGSFTTTLVSAPITTTPEPAQLLSYALTTVFSESSVSKSSSVTWLFAFPERLLSLTLSRYSIVDFENYRDGLTVSQGGIIPYGTNIDVLGLTSYTLTTTNSTKLILGYSDGLGSSGLQVNVWLNPYDKTIIFTNELINNSAVSNYIPSLYYNFNDGVSSGIFDKITNTLASYPVLPYPAGSYANGSTAAAGNYSLTLTNSYITEPTVSVSKGIQSGVINFTVALWVKGYVNGYAGLFYQGLNDFSSTTGIRAYTNGVNPTTFETDITLEIVKNNVVIAFYTLPAVVLNNSGFELLVFSGGYNTFFNQAFIGVRQYLLNSNYGSDTVFYPLSINDVTVSTGLSFHLGRVPNLSGGFYQSGVRTFDEVVVYSGMASNNPNNNVPSNEGYFNGLWGIVKN